MNVAPKIAAYSTTTAGLDPTLVGLVVVGAVAVILYLAWYLVVRGQSVAFLWTGLILGFRSLLAKELRTRSRGFRPAILLTFYLSMLSIGVSGFLAIVMQASGTISPVTGPMLFTTLAVGTVLLLAFITPALTSGAISGERERRTLDLLLVGRASSLGLVGGKLLGSIFYILFLLIAALPVFSVVYLYGGVPPLYLIMVLAVAMVTAVTHAALGLLLSAILRRTIVASAVSYFIVLALVFGIPFVAAVATIARGGAGYGMPPIYQYASPMVSLSSVLPSGRNGLGMNGIGGLMGAVFLGAAQEGPAYGSANVAFTHITYVVGADPTTGQQETVIAWAPWVYHFVLSGIFTLFCLLWTALAVAPVKPWQAWHLRRRQPSTPLEAAPGGEPA